MTERAICANCGEPIILAPYFLDGRLPNPPIWWHPNAGTTCATKAKDWKRPDWPHAHPSMASGAKPADGGITLETALKQAEAHEAALTELYGRLRAEGHAYASAEAHIAKEGAHSLVKQLREDLLTRAVDEAVKPPTP